MTEDRAWRRRRLRMALTTAVGALAAVVTVASYGDVHGPGLRARVVAFGGTAVFALLAMVTIRNVGAALASFVRPHGGRSATLAARLAASFVGYAVVLTVGLALLSVSVTHLLVGGALTGVIVGIAAQQALGNLFAGVVLLLARPFQLGERVRIRAGALAGMFDGVVVGMSLAYVTIHTDEGRVNVPNSAMLAAAVGPAPVVPEPAAGAPSRGGGGPGRQRRAADATRRASSRPRPSGRASRRDPFRRPARRGGGRGPAS